MFVEDKDAFQAVRVLETIESPRHFVRLTLFINVPWDHVNLQAGKEHYIRPTRKRFT